MAKGKGTGTETVKEQYGIRSAKHRLCRCSTLSFLSWFFLFFFIFFHFLTSLYDYDMKIPNLAFYRGRDQNNTIFFLKLDIVHRRQIKQFDKLNTAEL